LRGEEYFSAVGSVEGFGLSELDPRIEDDLGLE